MLNDFLCTKIEEEDIGNIWFQQDRAKRHTAEATLDVLRPVFEDRIISLSYVVFPPRSYDLTPLDYYLKISMDIVYTFPRHIMSALLSVNIYNISPYNVL